MKRSELIALIDERLAELGLTPEILAEAQRQFQAVQQTEMTLATAVESLTVPLSRLRPLEVGDKVKVIGNIDPESTWTITRVHDDGSYELDGWYPRYPASSLQRSEPAPVFPAAPHGDPPESCCGQPLRSCAGVDPADPRGYVINGQRCDKCGKVWITEPPAEPAPYVYMPGEMVEVPQPHVMGSGEPQKFSLARYVEPFAAEQDCHCIFIGRDLLIAKNFHPLTPQAGDLVVNCKTGEGGKATAGALQLRGDPIRLIVLTGQPAALLTPDWRVVWRKEAQHG